MRRFLPLLAAFCGSLTAAPEPPPTIPVAVYCFSYAPKLDTVYLRTAAASYQKVELSTANIVGPENAVIDNGTITLHRQQAGPEGSVTWPLVGRVRLPADCPRALILLLPAAAGEPLPYRGMAFAHTASGFPMGSLKMVNLSPFGVRGSVGTDTVLVRSGAVENFQPKGEPGVSLPVLFEYQRDNRWQRMTATRWSMRDDRRTLMCIFEDPVTKRMNMRSIPDRTMPAN
jgi:hypothetical protein